MNERMGAIEYFRRKIINEEQKIEWPKGLIGGRSNETFAKTLSYKTQRIWARTKETTSTSGLYHSSMPVPSSDSTAGAEELTVKMLRSSNIPYSPRLVNALSLGMLSDDFAALQTKDLTFCPTMVLSNRTVLPSAFFLRSHTPFTWREGYPLD